MTRDVAPDTHAPVAGRPGASPRTRYLLGGCLAAAGLAFAGTCGGVGIAWLANRRPAGPSYAVAPSPYPTPIYATRETATPPPLPDASEEEEEYALNWPGPPVQMPPVELPPAPTDQAQLDEAQRLYEQGKRAFDLEQWEEAIGFFDRALDLNPRHAEAYNYRGAAHRHVGRRSRYLNVYLEREEMAITDLSRAIAADPTWWRSYNNRGVSYADRARIEPFRPDRKQWRILAMADFARALELDPAQSAPHCSRSSIYCDAGDCDRGLEDALACTAGEPGNDIAVIAAYRCRGDYARALARIEELLPAQPLCCNLLWGRADVYFAMGEYAKALADYEAVIENWQGEFAPGQLWYRRAAAEYHLGRYEHVEEYIETGRGNTWVDWGEPYYYLGMIYLQQGWIEDAAAALHWAEITLDETNPLLEATRAELEKLAPQLPAAPVARRWPPDLQQAGLAQMGRAR